MNVITCKCEKTIEIDIPDRYNLSEQPQILEEILDGTFLTIECPYCGIQLKPELQITVFDSETGLDILVVPEKERSKYFLDPSSFGDHNRVAIGYPELVEKMRMHKADLSDRVVELIKYLLYAKSGGGTSVAIRFGGVEGSKLLFEIHGVRDQEIGIARISADFYDRMSQELPKRETEEPFDTILAPPYVSLTKVELEGY